MKKTLLKLGAFVAPAGTIASVIACSDSDENKVLNSDKTTEQLEELEKELHSSGMPLLYSDNVNEKLGIDKFKKNDESSAFYIETISSLISDEEWPEDNETFKEFTGEQLEGFFWIEKENIEGKNIKEIYKEETEENPEYMKDMKFSFFLLKSSNAKEENLEKAKKVFEEMKKIRQKMFEEMKNLQPEE